MAELGQDRTHAAQQTVSSLDHLVGASEQRRWHGVPERFHCAAPTWSLASSPRAVTIATRAMPTTVQCPPSLQILPGLVVVS
jgi:hypothetical protein